ncbi:YbaB/EbfC family nucleoid-associated protein [Granulicatella elegans]|jgi:DNA-binding protein, ybaB/ebfC family|uniref:Nucleoid-associated protein HMPREF0446_01078 n=1 Tax=Granulicatella elegans ATCC 700633 TaxID=626369 RepID=D0BM75_9LACT|nr:YbaB/EbfC family nucleoid-associated protein [Granulicatella elegans]EEW93090.1 YbaB/EbfC family DNA-binding protein [Granulicatella elegans ATCC 700633]RKW26252.1 MAG: YbaB/EbfC family nucleoid-associated protein [Granulicatella sp.]UEA32217.1 YbaB/EbfC family nucleoid-associated protein [Granulicatella elegans]
MRGMGNMQGMMKQMQKLQKQMAQAQEELNQTEYVGSSQSDLVQVTVNGKRQVLSVSIKPEAVDGDDVELLQDLVLMATNRALEQAEKANEQTMGQFTRGLNIPGF